MQSSTAMQQSCTFAEGNCFFPVNKEEKAEEEITTAMQSFPAMQQSCTSGPRQSFLSSERGGEEGGGRSGGGGGQGRGG